MRLLVILIVLVVFLAWLKRLSGRSKVAKALDIMGKTICVAFQKWYVPFIYPVACFAGLAVRLSILSDGWGARSFYGVTKSLSKSSINAFSALLTLAILAVVLGFLFRISTKMAFVSYFWVFASAALCTRVVMDLRGDEAAISANTFRSAITFFPILMLAGTVVLAAYIRTGKKKKEKKEKRKATRVPSVVSVTTESLSKPALPVKYVPPKSDDFFLITWGDLWGSLFYFPLSPLSLPSKRAELPVVRKEKPAKRRKLQKAKKRRHPRKSNPSQQFNSLASPLDIGLDGLSVVSALFGEVFGKDVGLKEEAREIRQIGSDFSKQLKQLRKITAANLRTSVDTPNAPLFDPRKHRERHLYRGKQSGMLFWCQDGALHPVFRSKQGKWFADIKGDLVVRVPAPKGFPSVKKQERGVAKQDQNNKEMRLIIAFFSALVASVAAFMVLLFNVVLYLCQGAQELAIVQFICWFFVGLLAFAKGRWASRKTSGKVTREHLAVWTIVFFVVQACILSGCLLYGLPRVFQAISLVLGSLIIWRALAGCSR